MRWMWLWTGPCFGYREGADVWTYDGSYVGMFVGTEIYAPSGAYLGEIRNRDRLIVDRAKSGKTVAPFEPKPAQGGHARYGDELGYPLSAAIGDFPSPRSFRTRQEVN